MLGVGSGYKGGYFGFQLAYLPKLRDTKSADNKLTLLECVCVGSFSRSFIYDYMEKEANRLPSAHKHSALLTLLEDFAPLARVKGKDFEQLRSDFGRLRSDYEFVKRQRKVPPCCADDLFAAKMEAFSEEVRESVETVSASMNTVEEYYRRFITKYGGVLGGA